MTEIVREEDVVHKLETTGAADLKTVLSATTSDATQKIIHILGKIDSLGQVISEVSSCYIYEI